MLNLKSPAKINLFLKIVGKRPDGFHDLASLFQTIDLADTLILKKSSYDRFTCDDPRLSTDVSNLVRKALLLFRAKTGVSFPVSIHLSKKIPKEAGLGGGSSNAATMLWGLNELAGKVASYEKLCEWGSEIGSDVSFFFSTGTAYCTGRGEKIQILPPFSKQKLFIVKPSHGLSTKEVYGRLNLNSLTARDPNKHLQDWLENKPSYFNDLEIPAFDLMPKLSELKQWLVSQGFSTVLMSGSGTSFFCIGNSANLELAQHAIYPTSFINRHIDSWY